MAKHKDTKAATILKLLRRGVPVKDITKRMPVSYSYVWKLHKELNTAANSVLELVPSMEVKPGEFIETPKANTIQEGGDHYKQMPVEPWDIYDSWPAEQRIGAYRANCVKYVLRLEHKDSRVLNARKLKHYASKLVEVAEELEAKEK